MPMPRMYTTTIAIPPRLRAELQKIADQQYTSFASIVRQAAVAYVEQTKRAAAK